MNRNIGSVVVCWLYVVQCTHVLFPLSLSADLINYLLSWSYATFIDADVLVWMHVMMVFFIPIQQQMAIIMVRLAHNGIQYAYIFMEFNEILWKTAKCCRWHRNRFSHTPWPGLGRKSLNMNLLGNRRAALSRWAWIWIEQYRSLMRCTCRFTHRKWSMYFYKHSNGWWMDCWMSYEQALPHRYIFYVFGNEHFAVAWKSVTLVTQPCHNTPNEEGKN